MRFRKDELVKVEYEARVVGNGGNYEEVYVRPVDGHGPAQYVGPRHLTLVEPEYVPDGIYQDAEGIIWRRTTNRAAANAWQFVGPHAAKDFMLVTGTYYSDSVPTRPLTRLVPEK